MIHPVNDSHLPGARARRPERRLVLACARTRLAEEHLAHIRHLAPRVDWHRVCRLAFRHNLAPLVHRALSTARAGSVPADVLSALRSAVMQSASRSLHLASELLDLLRTFEAAGVRALPFKGAALAAATYGGVALRPFNDIDLLVHPSDASRAAALLAARGFAEWGMPAGADQEAAQLACECEHAFHRPDGVCVDLHWRLSRRHFPLPLEFEDLWRRARPCTLRPGTDPIPALCPADALQVLCMHGTKHAWERLAWVCDVAELLAASPDLPWDSVLSQAEMLGSQRMLSLGLSLAHNLLGSALPPQVRRRLNGDAGIAAIARQVCRQLFRDLPDAPADSSDLAETVRHCLFHLRVRNGTRDRLRYCLLAAAPTTRDLRSAALPPPLYFLYYLTRPLRLLAKHLPGAAA